MDPLVSFVVPCYKLAHLLPECISSILAQTYQNFEILIMDNCSPDNTPEVARSFDDPRVKHVRNEANLGHLRNFNKGIGMSRGKYVWLISADDALRSGLVLQRFVDRIEGNPRVGYVFCRAVNLRGGKEAGIVEWADCGGKDRVWRGAAFLRRLIWSNCIVMSSCMVRKGCYDQLGLFPLDMPYACDWNLWCNFAMHYDVAYFAEPMVRFREHEDSLTTSFNRKDPRICIMDEVTVVCRLRRQAQLAGLGSLRKVCNASIASRLAPALAPRAAEDEASGLTAADFEATLRDHVQDKKDAEEIRALAYIALGDIQYKSGEYAKAARSYWIGLKLRPWRWKSWMKYLLLRMGSIGIRLRELITAAARLPFPKWLVS